MTETHAFSFHFYLLGEPGGPNTPPQQWALQG